MLFCCVWWILADLAEQRRQNRGGVSEIAKNNFSILLFVFYVVWLLFLSEACLEAPDVGALEALLARPLVLRAIVVPIVTRSRSKATPRALRLSYIYDDKAKRSDDTGDKNVLPKTKHFICINVTT